MGLVQPELLVELVDVPQLPHVLHEEGEVRRLEVGVGALGEVELHLGFESGLSNELFKGRNELSVTSGVGVLNFFSSSLNGGFKIS